MKLVIAEKPSVAQSIARVIGAAGRKDGYMEGNGYLVSWCVGHLVELSAPETYDERYSKWRLEDLPILPESWLYQVSSGTKKQFGILKELMKRPDVESLVCATDAGREGELIFRLVYNQCRCKKPFERLWISSMEDAAIRDGFQDLKPGSAYDNLYEAALCRERADWIVGMNATRLFSCLYGTSLAVGRVMTPTLGMAVMREAEIRAFKPAWWMDSQVFLGGSEPTTLKDLSEALGKETIDIVGTSDTRGNSPSYGTNYQKLGKELMSRDEIAVLDGSKCVLQLRGVRPFLSDKYDLTQHPNYKYTADFDKKFTFDIEKFLNHRMRLKTNDEYEVVEAHEEVEETA